MNTMTTTAENTARSLFAAALAATLTLGVTAAPALADCGLHEGGALCIEECDITTDEAIAIACASLGVDPSRLIGANCMVSEYFGHTCYEVRLITPGGPDPMGGYASYYLTTYTVYVDTATGAVLDGHSF